MFLGVGRPEFGWFGRRREVAGESERVSGEAGHRARREWLGSVALAGGVVEVLVELVCDLLASSWRGFGSIHQVGVLAQVRLRDLGDCHSTLSKGVSSSPFCLERARGGGGTSQAQGRVEWGSIGSKRGGLGGVFFGGKWVLVEGGLAFGWESAFLVDKSRAWLGS